MDSGVWKALQPTLAMLADELRRAGVGCSVAAVNDSRPFSGVRLWRGGERPRADMLFVCGDGSLPPENCAVVVTGERLEGRDGICCPGRRPEEILNLLLEVFFRLRDWESELDRLVCRDGSLQELCELGQSMLDNPVSIHDDWFIMVAMSSGLEGFMAPEHVASSTRGFVPRTIVEEFQHDADYMETYAYHDAQLWYNNDGAPQSIYVNLWNGTIYRGRLLVIRQVRDFRPGDFLVAEALTQRASVLLQRKQAGGQQALRSMDDRFGDLLSGKALESAELTELLNLLGWDRADGYLCIRLRSQLEQPDTLMEHMLHSDLFRVFPKGYILLSDHEQCLILNLSQEKESSSAIRSRLAPLCRDYCMYAGTSSPVPDIRELHLAYHQARVALDTAFRLRGERWNVAFSQCAMEYLLERLDSPLPPVALVSPELLRIRDCDREKGTQYFETLRTWLLEERDIPRTAQKLIIHRTTLLYRLKKLLPMLGLDLNDPWNRMYLTWSLWILEREGRSE